MNPPPPDGGDRGALPVVIIRGLAAYTARRHRLVLLRALGEAALALVGLLVIGVALDAWARPPDGVRLALGVVTWALVLALVAWRGLRPALRREVAVATAQRIEAVLAGQVPGPGAAHVADAVARASGRLRQRSRTVGSTAPVQLIAGERLSSAVALAQAPPLGVSAWMVARTVAIAAQEIGAVDTGALVDARPAHRVLAAAGVVAVVLAVACLQPGVAARLARAALPGAGVLRPALGTIEVAPGSVTVPAGGRLAVVVRTAPAATAARLRLRWDDGVDQEVDLAPGGAPGVFTHLLPAMVQGLRYQALAGDGESREHQVLVVAPPALTGLRLRIVPPAYAQVATREVAGGDAEMVAGSTLTVAATFGGGAVAAASLVFSDGATTALVLDDDRRAAHASLSPARTLGYGLRLVAADGLVVEPAQRWVLGVLPDVPPTAQLRLVGGGTLIADDEVMLVQGAARDDLGLRRAELVVADDSGVRERRAMVPTGLDVVVAESCDLAALGVGIGDRLSVAVEAGDSGGQSTRSKPVEGLVAAGDAARAAALAARLRGELKALDRQAAVLRQALKAWTAVARTLRPEDPGAQRGEVLLAGERTAAAFAAIAIIADRVVEAGGDHRLGGAPAVRAVGGSLGAWARLGGSLGLAGSGAPGAVTLARECCAVALDDLAGLRQDLGLVVARLDADGLVGAAEAALARIGRASAVVLAARGWNEPAWQPGLFATWWAGSTPVGTPLAISVSTLPLAEAAPAGRRTQWWARLDGELRLPSAGLWEFALTADDEATMSIAGQPLSAAPAAREWRGQRQLAAGWHALRIDWRQRTGASRLLLRAGPAGGALVALAADQLRCRAVADESALVAAMAAQPAGDVDRALVRSGQAVAVLLAVPDAIRRLGDEAAVAELATLATTSQDVASELTVLDRQRSRWDAFDMQRAGLAAARLVAAARQARDRVQHVDVEAALPAVGWPALTGAAAAARLLAQRAQMLRAEPEDLPAADLDARVRRELAVATALVGAAVTSVSAGASSLAAVALRAQAPLAERAQALLDRERLLDGAAVPLAALRAAVSDRVAAARDPAATGKRLAEAAADLAAAVSEAGSGAATAAGERQATRAGRSAGLAAQLARAITAGDDALVRSAVRQLATLAAAGMADAVVAGDHATAARLARAIAAGDPVALAAVLAALADDRELPASTADLAVRTLRRLAAPALPLPADAAPLAVPPIAEQLAVARLALALESERQRLQDHDAAAAAWQELANDLSGGPAALATVARAAERLVDGDDGRRQRAIAARRPGAPAMPAVALRLDGLSARAVAAAAEGRERREALHLELATLAPPSVRAAVQAALAAVAGGDENAVDRRATRVAAARADLMVAAREFSTTSRRLVEQIAALHVSSLDPGLGSAVTALGSGLPALAAPTAALAGRTAGANAAEPVVLARAASELVARAQRDLAQPLAAAWRATADDRRATRVADLARKLASALAGLRLASERLAAAARPATTALAAVEPAVVPVVGDDGRLGAAAAAALASLGEGSDQHAGWLAAAGTLAEAAAQARLHAIAISAAGAVSAGPAGAGAAGPAAPVGLAVGAAASPAATAPDWSRARSQLDERVRSAGIEHFSEEHQEQIRAYFQRLGGGGP